MADENKHDGDAGGGGGRVKRSADGTAHHSRRHGHHYGHGSGGGGSSALLQHQQLQQQQHHHHCHQHRFGSGPPGSGKIMLVQGDENLLGTLGSGGIGANGANGAAADRMAANGNGAAAAAAAVCTDRIRQLYANVNEDEFPLPRAWSAADKCTAIGLTQNNLRVHYKGVGKNHNDAASVRTAHPIPAACGLYYFEVKIISKGRDGYMGIGLTAQHFKMNRLPGWDKQSFGYHGDDGNSFCSSGNGQPYGPTFTTGDIIGCGVNLVNSSCFYTKNGHHLGTAFRDLPSKLYPTVGLQTPGEVVDANFGQEPFKFEIEDMVEELRSVTQTSIYNNPLPDGCGDWSATMHKLVSSYLVHHGYTATAESFARSTNTQLMEDVASMRNRQKIIKMVMSGRMGKAIEHTQKSYPSVLESNPNLLFTLKCRQFVEMVNGSDFETTSTSRCDGVGGVCGSTSTSSSNSSISSSGSLAAAAATPLQNPAVPTSVIQSTKAYKNGQETASSNTVQTQTAAAAGVATADACCGACDAGAAVANVAGHTSGCSLSGSSSLSSGIDSKCKATAPHTTQTVDVADMDLKLVGDVEMESNNGHQCGNGNNHKNGADVGSSFEASDAMDIDPIPQQPSCAIGASRKSSKSGVERMLEFGRELFQLNQRLEIEQGTNETNQKMLEDAFSLLAYSNPWSSPLGWQLCPSRRETVCALLNSAILESLDYAWRPPLENCLAHSGELLSLMAGSSIGACAFASLDDVLQTAESPAAH